MKILKTLCVASMLALGVASTASAFSFSPTTGTATFRGATNLVKGGTSLACTSTFTVVPVVPTGGTLATTGRVTAASFSGGLLGICSTVTASGLPWVVTPLSLTSVQVSGVAVNTPIGNCTSSTLTGAWTNGPPAAMSFTSQPLAPDCFVTGNLIQNTGAPVTIVNP